MKYCQEYAEIIHTSEIAEGIFDIVVKCPQSAAIAKPGQFVNILADGFTLRRPISICEIDKENETLRLVMQIRGEGTEKIAQKQAGERLDIVSPLGNGFSIEKQKRAVVVGGGIGVPPMLETAKHFDKCTAILGFRSKDFVILEKDFNEKCETIITTDDGSYGTYGIVTQPLEEMMKKGEVDVVLCCGPTPMLKGIAQLCQKYNIECQVSMEQRMACGVGACLVCACKTNTGMQHVCKCGPVFNGAEVKWDE